MLLGVLLTIDIVDTGVWDCLAGCLCFGLLVELMYCGPVMHNHMVLEWVYHGPVMYPEMGHPQWSLAGCIMVL